MNTVCHSVFFQLSDLSLEELGIESVEDIVWKSADGLKHQMWSYSLLGALDAAISHYLPMVLDSNASNRAAKAVTDLISTHTRLCSVLHGASRTKALRGQLCLAVNLSALDMRPASVDNHIACFQVLVRQAVASTRRCPVRAGDRLLPCT